MVGYLRSTCPGSIRHKHKCAKGSLADLACPTAGQPAQPAQPGGPASASATKKTTRIGTCQMAYRLVGPRDKYLLWVSEIATDVLPAGKAPCGAQPSRAKRGPTREARHSPAREARSAAAEGGGPRRRRRPPPKAAAAVRRPRAARGLQTQTRGDSTARDSAAADLTRMHAFPGSSAPPAQV